MSDTCTSGNDRSDLEGLDRCDDLFVANLHMELIGEGSPGELPGAALREVLSDEQIESVMSSYLLCLSASETIERLSGEKP